MAEQLLYTLKKIQRSIIAIPFVFIGFFGGLLLFPAYYLFSFVYDTVKYNNWTTADSELMKEAFVDVLKLPYRVFCNI